MLLSNSANYFYRKRRIVLALYLPCPPSRLHRGHCPSLNHPFPNASENLSNQLSFSTLSHHFGFWSSQCMCPLYGQVLFVKGVLLYLGLSNCLLVVVHGKKCFLWHASGLALRLDCVFLISCSEVWRSPHWISGDELIAIALRVILFLSRKLSWLFSSGAFVTQLSLWQIECTFSSPYSDMNSLA